jgi:AraC-like DNA-binding protein
VAERKSESRAEYRTIVLPQLAGLQHGSATLLPRSRPLALHANISSAGFELRSGTDRYDWHGRRRGATEFVLLQHTLAGEGRLTVGREHYAVSPGSTMLLHFPADNRYWLTKGGSWEFAYLCLHGREVLRAWLSITDQRGPLIELDPASSALALALETCRDVLTGAVPSQYAASAAAYGIAMALLAETLDEPPRLHPLPGIEAAKEFARTHFAEPIGVEDMARVAGYSRFHFSRLFAAREGTSPAAYVTDLRIRAAAALLHDTALPVATVAARCGFNDATYFSRAFRSAVGVSPGDFRRSGMY